MGEHETTFADATLLVVETQTLVRMALASYLRQCGYKVIEAATTCEATTVLNRHEIRMSVLLAGITSTGKLSVFELLQYTRSKRPEIETVTFGSPTGAARTAGDLCHAGPAEHPYDPTSLESHIRQLLAHERARSTG
jgi:DNA-binding NtrC family response regulator